MKCIVYERQDGGVAIDYPAERYVDAATYGLEGAANTAHQRGDRSKAPSKPVHTADQVLMALAARTVVAKGHKEFRVAELADVPADRSYRDAWTFASGKFGHDMAKAREIHRAMIREARKPLMDAADVEVSKALAKGDGAKAKTAEDARQKLRDATADPRIDAAATIDALKAVWPL